MIGQTISHYLIEERLGKGGMGVVWRARDTKLNRAVAIKFINSEVADEDHRRRFQREALIASQLNHPNIVAVFEAGTHLGQQYIVTEFVDGFTLKQWAKQSKPSIRQIVEILMPIADALGCAHEAGIVHRDVKPENVLISKQGFAKLTDFGLAKLIEAQLGGDTSTVTPTAPGHILGTIPYMSPEQLSGKPVDTRTDLWAFGVALFEVIAGKRPFAAKGGAELINSIIKETPAPLAQFRADAPAELQRIIDKALEKESTDRYQSAREIAVDMRRMLRRPPEEPEKVRRPAKSWPWIAAATIALAAAAVFATLWLRARAPAWVNPLENAIFTRVTDWEGTELEGAISPDGKQVAFLADRDGEFDVWVTPAGGGVFTNLTKGSLAGLMDVGARRVAFSSDGTRVHMRARDGAFAIPVRGGTAQPAGFPVIAASPLSTNRGRLVTADKRMASNGAEEYLSIAASSDGRRLVATVANPSATLWSVPITTGLLDESAMKRYPAAGTRVRAPRLGPDFVLYLADGGLWKLRYGVPSRLWTGGVAGPLALSPDARTVAFSDAQDPAFRLMSIDGSNPRPLAKSMIGRGTASWSPDGKWIVVAVDSGARILKVPVDGGEPEVLVPRPSRSPLWSPDGRVILFEEGGSLAAVTPAGVAVELPKVEVSGDGDAYRFIPGSRQVVLLLGEGRRRNFWLLDLATGQRRQLTNLRGGYDTQGFDVTRDGKEIVFDRLRENSDIVLIERAGR